MAVIGMDISSNRIAIAEISGKRNNFSINNAAVFDLPDYIVEKGEIKDTRVFSQSLRDIWNYYRFSTNKVYIGITNPKVIAKEIKLPVTEEGELDSSIKYQINELVPIAKNNISYDYFIIEKGDNFSRVMIAGAAKNVIEGIVEGVRLAKLSPVAMDLNCFSLYRLINNFYQFSKEKENNAYCLVNIGKSNTIIDIVMDNEIKFPRFSNMGLKNFMENISKELDINYKKAEDLLYGFDFTTEFDVKFDKGSEYFEEKVGNENINGADIKKSQVVKKIANQFVSEINRSIDFFLQENQNYSIDKIILCGDVPENFEVFFESQINYDTELFDIAKNFDIESLTRRRIYKDKDLSMLVNHLALAIGMAFRGYRI